jgi:hypothetical protein
MAQLVNDDLGLPIPQYMSASTGLFEAMRGADGAIYVKNLNDPTDGVFKAKLYAADGSLLNVTATGVPVRCDQHAVNLYEYDSSSGTWVPKAKTVIPDAPAAQKVVGSSATILASAVRTASVVSSSITNEMGARNAFLLIDVTATAGSITGVEIKIPVTGTNVVYKTITLGTAITAVGKSIVTFGVDDTTNKFGIPQTFVIDLIHADTSSITYSVDLQLS